MEYINYSDILGVIDEGKEPTRASIAKRLGLSRTTVSNVVNALIDDGIVREGNAEKSMRGRPGLKLNFTKDRWYALGASIMDTRWSFVVTGLDGRIQDEFLSDEISPFTVSNFLNTLVSGLKSIISRVHGKLLPAIGLGLPGVVDTDRGRILFANDIHWHDIVPVADYVEREIPGFRIFTANRYTASGLAENKYANPEGVRNLVYVGIGAGIRAAVFIDGKLLVGSTYSAGRIAHITVNPDGALCDCGKRGCLLTVSNSSALVSNANRLRALPKYSDSRLNKIERALSFIDVVVQADSGDACAVEAVDLIAVPLAKAISEIAEIINPNKLVIGGSLGYSCTYLVNRVRDLLSEDSGFDGSNFSVEQAKLRQTSSPLGAASLVLDHKAELLFFSEQD